MEGLRTYLCLGLTKPEFEISYEGVTAMLSSEITDGYIIVRDSGRDYANTSIMNL
jgi:hypothetical protein